MNDCRQILAGNARGEISFKNDTLKNHPYQHGYVDFRPWCQFYKGGPIHSAPDAPKRETTFDDLCFYFQNLSEGSLPLTPDVAALVLKKLILSHYMCLIEYTKGILSDKEYRCSTAGNKKGKWTVQDSGDVLFWTRRISEYTEHIEGIIDTLRISLRAPESTVKTHKAVQQWDTTAVDDDFRRVHKRLSALKKRSTDLIMAGTGVLGIIDAEISNQEAKSMRTLTILGLLFVPLSFSSGLFGMEVSYMPGGPKFWIFWAVALPLILATLTSWFILTELAARLSKLHIPRIKLLGMNNRPRASPIDEYERRFFPSRYQLIIVIIVLMVPHGTGTRKHVRLRTRDCSSSAF